MRHIPRSSRIFIGLVIITFALTYIALSLSSYKADFILQNTQSQTQTNHDNLQISKQTQPETPHRLLDTTDWKSYIDKNYPISFLYPKTWKISSSINKLGFYDIYLNPGAKFFDIHIYISPKSYAGLEGLPQTPTKVGQQTGFSVSPNLIGIKVGESYYTFDGSMNSTHTDEFNTLLSTVKFE